MRFPAVFFGHGNPMNAITTNAYTEKWRALGLRLPRPQAIVCISAHWYQPGAAVTIHANPRTIHDFGGFPSELYAVQYRAPGAPEMARRIQQLLRPLPVALDDQWGLDHGTWSVLCHLFPKADIPVVQLSIDDTQPGAFHFAIGQRLAPLREENILIMGSGNLVHNLHAYAWGQHHAEPYDWAVSFESRVREYVSAGNGRPLIDYESMGNDARLSVPTPDHYLPLLYVMGTQQLNDPVTFPVEGVDGGSISMLTVQLG